MKVDYVGNLSYHISPELSVQQKMKEALNRFKSDVLDSTIDAYV